MRTLEELKEVITERLNPEEFVDLLEVSTEELVTYCEDLIIERRGKFRELEDE